MMRTLVTFHSDLFNTQEVKEHFLNPCCFGDDAANWIADRLRRAGTAVDEIEQEDFGWYLTYDTAEGKHCLVIGYRPEDDSGGCWIAWVERHVGFLRSLFGGRNAVSQSAIAVVHEALQDSEIHDARWHERTHFDRGDENRGTETPF